MKRAALVILLVATVALALGQAQPPKIIDVVFLVPNGFRGPIFVDQRPVLLPEVNARQKNTYQTVVVDEAGEAVKIGEYDLMFGTTYPYSVVQRNGVAIKVPTEGVKLADNDVAFWVMGGHGPERRAYRPGGFGAYFIGTKAQADEFRTELRRLLALKAGNQ
jgi:hypothetical protein